jgi:hypothetical protein
MRSQYKTCDYDIQWVSLGRKVRFLLVKWERSDESVQGGEFIFAFMGEAGSSEVSWCLGEQQIGYVRKNKGMLWPYHQ